jgi:diguanylate cyclase
VHHNPWSAAPARKEARRVSAPAPPRSGRRVLGPTQQGESWREQIVFDALPETEPGFAAAETAARDREALLADELHHRVQNTLSVVLALARLTARSATTIDAFQVAFSARIQAMARTNALLLRGHAQAVDVRSAIEVELAAYASLDAQVTLECDAIRIGSDAALSLSLLIHELATNAAKYGALSTPAGRLAIRCVGGPAGAVLIWSETTPGLVAGVHSPGQGSRLIRHLARDLGGTAEINLLPAGLQATVSFQSAAPPRATPPL